MSKVLTFEEQRAKALAEAAERKKRSKPPKESKDAQVTAYRQFTKINSQAVYRGGCYDPKGYENYFPSEMNAHDIGREARVALLASRFITPDHPEWNEVMRFPTVDEIRAAQEANKARAGVKTLKALFSGAGMFRYGCRMVRSKLHLGATAGGAIGTFAAMKIGLAKKTAQFGKAIQDSTESLCMRTNRGLRPRSS